MKKEDCRVGLKVRITGSKGKHHYFDLGTVGDILAIFDDFATIVVERNKDYIYQTVSFQDFEANDSDKDWKLSDYIPFITDYEGEQLLKKCRDLILRDLENRTGFDKFFSYKDNTVRVINKRFGDL